MRHQGRGGLRRSPERSPPRRETRALENLSSTTLTCPQCGGENPLPTGERILTCAFCGATLFVDRGGLVSHYRLPRLLSREQASEALRRWMAGNQTVKNLDRTAEIQTAEAVTFPVWLFRLAGGEGETTRVEPAAPTPIPQLADLRLPAGELVPYRPEEGVAERMEATVPLETARGWLEGAESPAGSARRWAIRETALVELPLWRFTYHHESRSYTALVEGSTGAVLASVFPAKSEAPFYAVFLLALVLFTLAGFVVSNPLLKLIVYIVLALPLIAGAYWVARKV